MRIPPVLILIAGMSVSFLVILMVVLSMAPSGVSGPQGEGGLSSRSNIRRPRSGRTYPKREEMTSRAGVEKEGKEKQGIEVEGERSEIASMRSEVAALLERERARLDRKIVQLVERFRAWGPQRSASMMATMEDETVIQVLSRMRTEERREILKRLEKGQAKRIMARLGRRKR